MSKLEKALFGLNLVLIGFIIWLIFGFFNNSVENCWDKYQTENEAIMNCEIHNG